MKETDTNSALPSMQRSTILPDTSLEQFHDDDSLREILDLQGAVRWTTAALLVEVKMTQRKLLEQFLYNIQQICDRAASSSWKIGQLALLKASSRDANDIELFRPWTNPEIEPWPSDVCFRRSEERPRGLPQKQSSSCRWPLMDRSPPFSSSKICN